MDTTENDILLLEKFFDEEMNDAEREQLLRRVQDDEQFKALYEREKHLIMAIRHQGLQNNLVYLQSLEAAMQREPVATTSRKWYYLAAAAIAGTLVAVVVLLTRPNDPDKLFQAYFTPYPNVFDPTVRGEQTPQHAEAFQAYEQGNYLKAADELNTLYKARPDAGVLMLLGNANLMLGRVAEAKQNFITLNDQFDSLDLQAKWYLSLCYLKSGDLEQARKILSELEKTDISYASKARELLEKVK